MCAAAVCVVGVGAAPTVASPHSSRLPGLRVRVFRFVDASRTVRLPDGRRVPRSLVTVVRYPAAGGPYPLVVFGHGFTLTPARYARLLRAWAQAGYVVAAPVFPLENANAPGRSRRGRSDQPAAGHQLRHRETARPERQSDGRARREDRSVANRRRGSLRRRRDRARRRLRPPLSRPAHPCGDHPLGRGAPGHGPVPADESAAARGRRELPTRPTFRRTPRRTSRVRGGRSSCSGCSEQRTSLRTRISNHSSGSSSGPRSRSSTTT